MADIRDNLWRQASDAMLQGIGTTRLGVLLTFSASAITLVVIVIKGLYKFGLTSAGFMRALHEAFAPVAIAFGVTSALWLLVYAYFVVRTAERNAREYASVANRAAFYERRIKSLLPYVPRLSSSQIETLAADLKQAAIRDDKRGVVFIQYVDTPTSGASQLAYQIEVAFDRAGWRIERKGVSSQGFENSVGLMMFIEKVNEPTPRQRDVIAALAAAGLQIGYYPGANVTDDRIEFIVGNL